MVPGFPRLHPLDLVTRILTRYGIGAPAITAAWRLSTMRGVGSVNHNTGDVETDTIESAARFRAWYLVNAARRIDAALTSGKSLEDAAARERVYTRAHYAAQARRRMAARNVDAVAAASGPVLEWKAVLDSRTTPDCALADGHWFRATDIPLIGVPGAVHPRCRCQAVKVSAAALKRGTVNQATSRLFLQETA